MSELVKCPRCGSDQITANKQGFNAGKAAAGFFLTGGVGLLAGTLGANKVKVTCLACGHDWEAGQHQQEVQKEKERRERLKRPVPVISWISLGIILFTILYIIYQVSK